MKSPANDYWFKVIEMLQQNWALIDKIPNSIGCTVYFIHDASGVFDQMQFNSEEEAHQALTRNGFARFTEDLSAQKFIASPLLRPPLPLILAAWDHATGIEKMLRLRQHIEYAEENGVLSQIDRYLRGLPASEWYTGQ